MKTLIILLFLSVTALVVKEDGQDDIRTFHVGVMSTKGFMQKIPGEIVISDSTVTFLFNNQPQSKKVVNDQGTVIYVTDGTATDKLTITPLIGRVKGFSYDHSIVQDGDSRFNAGQIIFFCKRRP